MTVATAWEQLAEKERARHRRTWGRTNPVQYEKDQKPKPQGRTFGTTNPERLKQIKKWVRQGKKNVWIARELGIAEQSVRYWKKKYNLT